MWYIYIVNNIVQENIPEFNPSFPNVHIEKRYPQSFLKKCVKNDEKVPEGYLYDEETGIFSAPPQIEEPAIEDAPMIE